MNIEPPVIRTCLNDFLKLYLLSFFPDTVEVEVKELILDVKYPATKKQVIKKCIIWQVNLLYICELMSVTFF